MSPRKQCWLFAGLLLLMALIFMERVLFPPPGQAIGGLDVRGLFYPWLDFARASIGAGRLPLWDSYQFGGYPFFANPQVALFYPPTWLAILPPTNLGISWHIVLHIWLAGMGMLLFVRRQSSGWVGPLLAAIAWAFSGFMSARIFAGHIGLIATYAWLPWLLLGTRWSVERGDGWSAVIGGIPLGLVILAGHTTSLIYVGLAWVMYIVFLAWSRHALTLQVIRQAAITGVTGLVLSAVQLLPLLEFTRIAARTADASYEFATAYSMPPAHLIALLVPEFFGEPIRAGYWSVPNFEELTYYAGLLPILCLFPALRRPTRQTWFYLTLAALGLLLALGSYGFLYRLFYDLLPPFRLARAPGRAATLFTFAAAALLGDTISSWEQAPAEEQEKLASLLRWLLIGVGVIGIAGIAATGAAFAAQHPSETSGRLWHQVGGWALTLIAGLLGAGLLRAYFRSGGQRRLYTAGGLAALLVADLWTFGFKLVRLDPVAPAPLWMDAAQIIGQTDERVLPWGLSIFEQNGAGQVGLPSVFGYNALEIAANQQFLAFVPDPRSTAYDLMSVRYVIAGSPLDEFTSGERPLTLIGQTGAVWVYERERVMPLARLVYEVEVIPDRAAAIARIHAEDFGPRHVAILSQKPPCIVEASEANGEAAIVERRPGYWRIETRSAAAGLLVVGETAYPGWRVTVDGQRAEPLVAYTAIRSVCVSAGEHSVEWAYDPVSLKIGGGFSFAGLGLVGYATFRSRRHDAAKAETL